MTLAKRNKNNSHLFNREAVMKILIASTDLFVAQVLAGRSSYGTTQMTSVADAAPYQTPSLSVMQTNQLRNKTCTT